jgi:hypothetical protein
MITYPIKKPNDPFGSEVGKFSKIIADTTLSRVKFSNGVSEVLGMWIDQDDVQEPDKAVVLLRVDPKISDKSFGKPGNVDEGKFLSYKDFSVRHWMDIWIDYSGGFVGDIKDAVGLGSKFRFFDETHIFSGPIVSVDRSISKNGDRIALIAFDSQIALKNCEALNGYSTDKLFTLPEVGEEGEIKRPSIKEVLEDLIKNKTKKMSMVLEDVILGGKSSEEYRNDEFLLGDFTYDMLNLDSFKFEDFGTFMAFRLNRIAIPNFDEFIHDKFLSDKSYMFAPINIQGKAVSLWDVIKTIISPQYCGYAGIDIRIVHNRPSTTLVTGKAPKAETGIKHPGVYLQFYFTMETQELFDLAGGTADIAPGTSTTIWEDVIVQKATLGKDIVDMEMWMDYASVFNTLKVFTDVQILSKERKINPKALKELIPDVHVFPLQHDQFKKILEGDYDGEKWANFWKAVIDDIIIFGEQRYPVPKWFFVPTDRIERIEEGGLKLPNISGDLLKLQGMQNLFKRYYFGGIEGTVYLIGRKEFKKGRLLQISDERDLLSVDLGQATKDLLFNKFSGLSQLFGEPPEPYHKKALLNFEKYINAGKKPLYIWKVRHYMGANAGWLTKVYFSETRNRAYRAYSKDYIGTIREAQRWMQGQLEGGRT